MKVVEAETAKEKCSSGGNFFAERHLMEGQSQECCANGVIETELIQNFRMSRAAFNSRCLDQPRFRNSD